MISNQSSFRFVHCVHCEHLYSAVSNSLKLFWKCIVCILCIVSRKYNPPRVTRYALCVTCAIPFGGVSAHHAQNVILWNLAWLRVDHYALTVHSPCIVSDFNDLGGDFDG